MGEVVSQPGKNVEWVSSTAWGDLEISINLTKPEKDPRAIAEAAANPSCVLCDQNRTEDGWLPVFAASAKAAWPNLKIAAVSLDGDTWHLQYSPYHYFEKHCIAANERHIPMRVDGGAFRRLLQLVDMFPEFFMGSNAGLPVVGGSILAHDHFQGGLHEFPMDRASADQRFSLNGFSDVNAATLRWPLTVIRLECADKERLAQAAEHVLEVWRAFSDPQTGIVCCTEGVPHNAVTPIARKVSEGYRLDLALRCNITSQEHPLGVFHPHEHLHYLKKENIGLIEVMGLAILPPRVLGLLEEGMTRQQIADAFAEVLECCGVFKWDDAGRKGLQRFLSLL